MALAGKPTEEGKVKICTGHTRPICHINYSNIIDGTYWFVTSCHDTKPMLRNGQTGDWVGTFEGHKGAVYCSSFNAEATRLVTGSGDYTAALWDAISGQKLHSWTHPHYIKSCDWWDDKIATGCYDASVRIYDATNYSSEPIVVPTGFEPGKTVKACYFVEDTKTVVTANENGMIKKWDLRSNTAVAERDIGPELRVLEYTHLHSLVAAHKKQITFINPVTFEEVGQILTAEDVECASISPNGKHVAVGSKIKAKEFTIDGVELQSHRGHHGPVFHVRWAPDNTMFSSGSEDGMVRIWPCNDILSRMQE